MYKRNLIEEMLEAEIITQNDIRWEICWRCNGDGFLGGYPGVYTSEDFETQEDIEDYMSFKRVCSNCSGSGKVQVVNEEKEDSPEVRAYYEADYEDRMIRKMEMGIYFENDFD